MTDLRSRRERLEIPSGAMAEALGMPSSTYAAMELGRVSLPDREKRALQFIAALEKFFGQYFFACRHSAAVLRLGVSLIELDEFTALRAGRKQE